jgi:hypothetical protein
MLTILGVGQVLGSLLQEYHHFGAYCTLPIRPTLRLDISSSQWPDVAQEQLQGLSTRTMIHIAHKEYQLSSQDCAPSLKPAHHGHFTIICKTTNQAENKKLKN